VEKVGPGVNLKENCKLCGKQGHKQENFPTFLINEKETRKCFSCGQIGHLSNNCPNKKMGGKLNQALIVGSVGLVMDTETEETVNSVFDQRFRRLESIE
jgi:Zinc knuckle